METAEKNKLIDPGTYKAELINIYGFRNQHGRRWAFVFQLHDQAYEGRHITRTTSASMGPKSKLYETITSLNRGRRLPPKRFRELLGTRCIVLINQQQNRAGDNFNTIDRIFYGAKLA